MQTPYTSPPPIAMQGHALSPHRPQRARSAGDLAGPVAELRRGRRVRDRPRHPAPGVRPRASPTSTSPTTTARPTARRRRTSARSSAIRLQAAHRDELVISTKAGWDMWPGPYGGIGGSRKYLIASCDQSLKRMGARLCRHLLLAPRRSDDAAGGDHGRAGPPAPPGQGAVRRDLVLLARTDPPGPRDPQERRRAAADPPTVLLDGQPLDRGRAAGHVGRRSASAASPSRRWRKGC
jgi:hypothetical protein